jgi:hypothetical protein
MLDDFRSMGLFSLAELSYLRMEAMDLFERCLTEGKPDCLQTFIEQQILQEPPRLQLLRDVAEDLHQRLLSLREYHFDVRDRVIRTLRDDFKVDITPIAPANALDDYHLLALDNVLEYFRQQNARLTSQDEVLLRNMLEASLEMASQLHGDVVMTEHLYTYIIDWLSALNVTIARRSWTGDWDEEPRGELH